MATTPKKDTQDSPAEAAGSGVLQSTPTAAAAEHGDHDRIVMASRRADGSMDQINPEFIGDIETAKKANAEQLGQQAASAVDVAARGASTRPQSGEGSSAPDPDVKALKDAQEAAVTQATA
ncbi:MAG: hypothetical protein M3467_10150, partial [Actinomycetota bacterium]|nr:hypothetical protein [Actinomycetota bacterium]